MTIPDSVFENLCALIAAGTLKIGQRLPAERKLAEMLGVSRSSIREGIRTLETLGMIDTRVGSGSYLEENVALLSKYFLKSQAPKRHNLLEVLEARRVLECEIAFLAAQRVTPAGKHELNRLLANMLARTDPEEFLKEDFAFHEALAVIAKNFFLLEMLKSVRELMLDANKRGLAAWPGQQMQIALEYHHKLYQAIAAENPEEAKYEMQQHINNTFKWLLTDGCLPGTF
ncbi:MAG: FadR family transcriptional regulator [Deltaproteobacteria bacterium]|jgi:DNA-binding FadR family transcriptional regulator|nr:FadR family transcriptional regulator [Deltaproteobacteria bacterium]